MIFAKFLSINGEPRPGYWLETEYSSIEIARHAFSTVLGKVGPKRHGTIYQFKEE